MMPVNARPPKPPRVRRQSRLLASFGDTTPIATYSFTAVSVVVSILGLAGSFGLLVQSTLIYQAPELAPWQLISASFLNPSVLAFILNTIVFVLFGRIFERMIGRRRFVAFFFVGSFGAAVGALALGGYVYAGLSPVTVAMAAAIFVMQRHLGRTDYYLLAVLVFDVVISIAFGGQWQAIVGSLLIGALVGLIYAQTDRIKEGRQQNTLVAVLGVVLFIVGASGSFILQASS
jgi:membrane associated rhomboid family serine protease